MKPTGTNELPKDRDQLFRLCRESGCIIDRTNGNHIRIRFPTGTTVIAASTPSDWRGNERLRMDLKKAGLKVLTCEERTRPTELEKMVEPPPDRNPTLGDIAPPAMKEMAKRKKTPRGEIKKVIMESLRKINVPQGRMAADIAARVKVHFPHLSTENISTYMYGYYRQGDLELLGDGRYRVPDKPLDPPQVKQVQKRTNLPAPPLLPPGGVDMDTQHDLKVLDEALAALSKLEQVIRKHQQIAVQLAPLKALLAQMKGE